MANSVDHVTVWENINSDVKNLLIEDFKSSENIVKITYIMSSQKQIIDQAMIYMAKYRLISTATGAYLDIIGQELGVDREDSTDEEYRALLQIRAYRVTTNGTRPDIIDLFSRFTGTETTDVDTYVGRNKSFDIAFYTMCLNGANSVDELIKVFPVVSSYRLLSKGGTPLMFGSYYDDNDTDFLTGLGSYFDTDSGEPTEGGRLASLLYATS